MNLLTINKRPHRTTRATSLATDRLTRLLTGKSISEFLPPNVTQPKGEGSVLFTLQPRLGMVSSTIFTSGTVALPPLLATTTAMSVNYAGASGHTCGFHSVAHDAMGSQEDAPATPAAVTTVNPTAQNIARLAAEPFFRVHVQ